MQLFREHQFNGRGTSPSIAQITIPELGALLAEVLDEKGHEVVRSTMSYQVVVPSK